MTYRKFKADYLYLGDRMAEGDNVLITNAEGVVQSVVSGGEAGEGVEEYEGLLCPGFVNCHCHLELSHLKGVIPEGTGLVDFLSMVMLWRRRPMDEEDLIGRIKQAIVAGEQEMLVNGIVAVGDICNTPDTAGQKKAGRIRYHNFIETMGFIEQSAESRFWQSHRIFCGFAKDSELPIEANSIVPHAPYSVSPGLLRRVVDFPGNRLMTIHNQETEAENEFLETGKGDFLRLYAQLGLDVSFFRGTGKRSLASILPYFHHNQSLILVHNVATAGQDLGWAAGEGGGQAGLGRTGPEQIFCLCPNANLYIGGKLPDVRLLVERGCRIVVGTDSLASNHGLSILAELKTLQNAFPWLETATLLGWATSAGAGALQMDKVFGSFGEGKIPGVLLLEGLKGGRLAAGTTVRRLI
ncbi:MAG TPA: amidohydrolase family protein [Puia sp.]|jgi:cytosine/adenosine deaminase-related metal-dependent hydrolase|nr:amidohydrolase family protein [Puia sp.]